ncbi:avidin-like [Rhineura floridana]|uniref:avidin-like n=1 Tax=Rhineura floridana TaxID=261503 RepID=UPI002AC80B96|nr:avidin-like [Rhineura floridana]XP_061468528.1 avidin-like [Rhineura floridana]
MWRNMTRAPALALLGSLLAAAATASSSGSQILPVVEAAAEKRRKGILAGTWVNELGSKMVLNPPNEAGQFSGSYLTAVSAAEKRIQASPLFGVQHDPKEQEQPTFGFAVKWTFSDSTAAFVGQRFVDASGKESLETMWLLREEAKSPEDDWKATRIGRNVFTRVK